MLGLLADLVAPPRCGICGEPREPRSAVCQCCRGRLGRSRPTTIVAGGLRVSCAAPYDGVAGELIRAVKYAHRVALLGVAAEAMSVMAAGGLLVPVPAAPARLRARGHDDAHTLAKLIGRRVCLPVWDGLTRDDGPRQVGRTREQRRVSPPRVRLRGAAPPAGEPVWIVDDVVTTGATVGACARALRGGGIGEIRGLVFARSE